MTAELTLLFAEVLLRHAAGHQQLSYGSLDGHTELVLLGAKWETTPSTGALNNLQDIEHREFNGILVLLLCISVLNSI